MKEKWEIMVNANAGAEIVCGVVKRKVVSGRNESGESLLDRCEQCELVIASTSF